MVKTNELKLNKSDFTPANHDDYVRVDFRCKELVMQFYHSLVERGTERAEASILANGADYFIRDFVVDQMGLNLFTELPGIVRKFAGNWYIITTVDPSINTLEEQLRGIRSFYSYLHSLGLISSEYLAIIEKECADHAYYEKRIETFWEITGDGYLAWELECPLKSNGKIET